LTVPAALVRIEGVSAECAVQHATIRHGRDDPSSQPEGDSATLELVGPMPDGVEIGARLEVLARFGETDYPRFAGRVTDVAIGWHSVDVPSGSIVAIGELADLGRRVIGDAPYPSESDGVRVNRAITAAGVLTDAIRSDPGTLTVLARDVDAQPALAVATDAAVDGAGFVWQATDGAVLYADAQHRRKALPVAELDACDLPLSLAWSKGLEGLANDVRVRYGPAEPQAEVHVTDAASVAELGTFGASLSTRLASAADANARAQLIAVRQSRPAWVLAALALDLYWVNPLLTLELLGLEVHDLVAVTGMPAGAPMTSALVFVEGWTETISPGAWQIELAVSDYCRTAPAPAWDDLDPALTWDTLNPAQTWDSSTCVPPYVGRGRWADVPSSLRWDQVAPSETWDTWTG
jgi:hypothetical protein